MGIGFNGSNYIINSTSVFSTYKTDKHLMLNDIFCCCFRSEVWRPSSSRSFRIDETRERNSCRDDATRKPLFLHWYLFGANFSSNSIYTWYFSVVSFQFGICADQFSFTTKIYSNSNLRHLSSSFLSVSYTSHASLVSKQHWTWTIYSKFEQWSLWISNQDVNDKMIS